MKKIFQILSAVMFICLITGSVKAQSQNSNTKTTVTYELIKDTPPGSSDIAEPSMKNNSGIKQADENAPKSLLAPEHPGNKTREEAEQIADENKKKSESDPK
jgi:hypothetical protein